MIAAFRQAATKSLDLSSDQRFSASEEILVLYFGRHSQIFQVSILSLLLHILKSFVLYVQSVHNAA